MATKDDLYGMKPTWTFGFFKNKAGKWEVGKVERK